MKCAIKYIFAVLIALLSQNVEAQHILDMTLNSNFAAQVKSIDEFICRFNGTEVNPEIEKDSCWREKNLIALFDYQMEHGGLSDGEFKLLLKEFVASSIDNKVMLKLTDAEMWAEINASAMINGKKGKIGIVLKSETYKKDNVRWAIVAVKGLVKSGIIDTTNYCAISPVEHELHFMSIGDIFQNGCPETMGYRGKNVPIDELSVFLALSMSGKVKIDMVDKLTFYCLEVHGFAFTINEQGRSGCNSGWLISSLIPLKESDKKQYIKNILER